MSRKILFLGADGVGKTHLIMLVGKVLTELKKEILIIDDKKDVYSYFNYNSDVENELELTSTTRENMYITSDIKNIEKNKYDYILIENHGEVKMNDFYKIFIVQNYDKCKLIKNKKIIEEYKKYTDDFSNVHFIFNQMFQTSDRDFLFQELIGVMRTIQIMNNEDIEIPFNAQDLINASISKWNGNIRFTYSSEFKKSLYELVNIIHKVDEKQFRKIVERRY